MDKLMMENYLLIIKSTIEVYVHGTLESSNPDVRDTLKMGLDYMIKHQGNCYKEMTNRGWYKVKCIQPSMINQTLNSVQKN